uniref:DUF4868 domain-containing protein n=1 Tax=Candidatus Kentrum sp. TC TaxID=2126339 RepID=A0A450Y809_9GAMM|nr:MAG: protein of unknown function (DUF4868) [Candidatus Kentron sp. TC]
MDNLEGTLDRIKALDWNSALVSFFIVKRKLAERKAKYDVLHVHVDEKLREKLRDIVVRKIERSNNALEYDFNTVDLDDNLLSIPVEETDLQRIIDSLQGSEDPQSISQYEELFGSWMYIARLDMESEPPLFSARRIPDSWSAKKAFDLINMIYRNSVLVDLEQREVFHIDRKVDFFAFDGTIFIADKKNFETALNFRIGMEKNRDEIMGEFSELGLFDNASAISELVGNHLPRLRKLSQVKKAGYYKKPDFLESLKKVNEEDGWGIQYSQDGKILITENDIDTILLLLNNGRLMSQINHEVFDVDAKRKFSSENQVTET